MSTSEPKTGGLLRAALDAGTADPITWTDVLVGDLRVTVASDAIKASAGGRDHVRLPVTYAEQVAIMATNGWISPTKAIADAMYKQAKVRLVYVGLVMKPADEDRMQTVDFSLRFDAGVAKQLDGKDFDEADLVFGAWKLWILNARIVEKGAVNYGFWDAKGNTIQTVGGQHDAAHYDYSQLLQPVKRWATIDATDEAVDLAAYFAKQDKIPQSYLDPYGVAP